jgi:hypothetical protein
MLGVPRVMLTSRRSICPVSPDQPRSGGGGDPSRRLCMTGNCPYQCGSILLQFEVTTSNAMNLSIRCAIVAHLTGRP